MPAEINVPGGARDDATSNADEPAVYCSFCGKSQREVEKIIAGPKLGEFQVAICSECASLCGDILHEAGISATETEISKPIGPVDHDLRLRIADVRLSCFKLLDGFGTKDREGKHERWDLPTRKIKADDMAAWALDAEGFLGKLPVNRMRMPLMTACDLGIGES